MRDSHSDYALLRVHYYLHYIQCAREYAEGGVHHSLDLFVFSDFYNQVQA